MVPRVWVGPRSDSAITSAVVAGGGVVVTALEGADAVVWLDGSPEAFPRLPGSVRWVQLPAAGVERWVSSGLIGDAASPVWTTAAGAYGLVVAEHALALTLACLRYLPAAARADRWQPQVGRQLSGSEVLLIGAGGIGGALIGLLKPFEVRITAVTRSGRAVPGAARTLSAADLDGAWGAADVVVLAAPATEETRHLVDDAVLRRMQSHAVLVNVGRGSLVDTDALERALREERLGGAGLDVVDPEPLPEHHPLWSAPNVLITSHSANPRVEMYRDLARRVRTNVERLATGRPLVAPLEPARGY